MAMSYPVEGFHLREKDLNLSKSFFFISTTQLHSIKPELGLCKTSIPVGGVSGNCDDESLLQ